MSTIAPAVNDGFTANFIGFGLGCLGLLIGVFLIVFPKLVERRAAKLFLFGFVLTLITLSAYQVSENFFTRGPDWAKPFASVAMMLMGASLGTLVVKLGWHRGQAVLGVLFFVSLTFALGAGWGIVSASHANDLNLPHHAGDIPQPSWSPVATARTDHGTEIPLYLSQNPNLNLPTPAQVELASRLAKMVIETAPESASSNCHGWTFTGGRFHVDCADVPKILCDNGYQPTKRPRQGDLVVYQNDYDSTIVHTGIVRSVGFDGLILVESKWGAIGARYVHEPQKQPYSATFQYYHSRRFSHHLRGLRNPTPAPGRSVEPFSGPKVVRQDDLPDSKMTE